MMPVIDIDVVRKYNHYRIRRSKMFDREWVVVAYSLNPDYPWEVVYPSANIAKVREVIARLRRCGYTRR
jgi:hypothetical protein